MTTVQPTDKTRQTLWTTPRLWKTSPVFADAASLLQTADANAAGPAADAVQSVMVNDWNPGIAGGGVAGGLLHGGFGASSLAWGTLAPLVAALAIKIAGQRHAFPVHRE